MNQPCPCSIRGVFLLRFSTKFPTVLPQPFPTNSISIGARKIHGTIHVTGIGNITKKGTEILVAYTHGVKCSPAQCRTCSALTVPDNPKHCFLRAGWKFQLWWSKHVAYECWSVQLICFAQCKLFWTCASTTNKSPTTFDSFGDKLECPRVQPLFETC